MAYIALLASVALAAGSNVFIKLYQKKVDDKSVGDCVYFIIMIIVACLYFAFLAGFDLRLNLITALCSLVLAVISFLVNFFLLKAYKYTDMINVSVASSGGGIVIPALMGMIFLGDDINIKIISGIFFAVLSVVIPYFGSEKTGKNSLKGFLMCVMIFIAYGAAGAFGKIYTMIPGIISDSVYCFYANVFMTPFVLYLARKGTTFKETFNKAKTYPKIVFLIPVFVCLVANSSTYIAIFVNRNMDITVYSILNSALRTIIVSVFAFLFFKEKFTKEKTASMILAILASILTVV